MVTLSPFLCKECGSKPTWSHGEARIDGIEMVSGFRYFCKNPLCPSENPSKSFTEAQECAIEK